ncbi:MAG: KamA family radical SAM protein [Deltaproteobacteria bacterium]|nr:KamA family radical SAM protein [Deltaproteobacteria bacterium]
MEKEISAHEEIEPPGSGGVGGLLWREPGEALQPDPVPWNQGNRKKKRIAVSKKASHGGCVTSEKAVLFMRRHFPGVTVREWSDWQWQLQHCISSSFELDRMLRLSEDERNALARYGTSLPVAITPYYASLIDPDDPGQPIRRTVIPVTAEMNWSTGESEDPLNEDDDSPVPGLVHRYPDRVLFLVTDFCSTYCRYCTRSRRVGKPSGCLTGTKRWEQAIAYIESTPSIRDVLVSGGDPLTLSDDRIEWLLERLRRIPHVEVLRIGTKAPMVLPQRITPALVRMLKRYHPLWISIHCTHPDELTEETQQACRRLADAGIPLQSQTVLLSGINDDVATLTKLFHGLVRSRVRPYYLFQCDPIPGSGHFRTPVAKGIELMRGIRGFTSGFAVPTFVIDCPGGGGKVPIGFDYTAGHDGEDLVLRNYQGNTYRYPDTGADRYRGHREVPGR